LRWSVRKLKSSRFKPLKDSDGRKTFRESGRLIQREVSQMLVKSIKDPRIGFVTITKVTVSEDFRLAKVYFSVAGTLEERERSMKGLDSAKGYVRKELGRRIRLRYTPQIMFQFDPSMSMPSKWRN